MLPSKVRKRETSVDAEQLIKALKQQFGESSGADLSPERKLHVSVSAPTVPNNSEYDSGDEGDNPPAPLPQSPKES